jgi:hypothetical protein
MCRASSDLGGRRTQTTNPPGARALSRLPTRSRRTSRVTVSLTPGKHGSGPHRPRSAVAAPAAGPRIHFGDVHSCSSASVAGSASRLFVFLSIGHVPTNLATSAERRQALSVDSPRSRVSVAMSGATGMRSRAVVGTQRSSQRVLRESGGRRTVTTSEPPSTLLFFESRRTTIL